MGLCRLWRSAALSTKALVASPYHMEDVGTTRIYLSPTRHSHSLTLWNLLDKRDILEPRTTGRPRQVILPSLKEVVSSNHYSEPPVAIKQVIDRNRYRSLAGRDGSTDWH